MILKWTAELNAELALSTTREFAAAHPGLFTDAAIHIQRRKLRDAGVPVKASVIGRTPDPIFIEIPELPASPGADDIWNAYETMYRMQRQFDESKALAQVDLRIQTKQPFGIVFISDMHLGNKGVDVDRLREDIALIQTCDRLRVYMGGDWCDNFVIQALAHVHRDESLVPLEIQFELFKLVMAELAPQLLAVGSGNHDAWTKRMCGLDPALAMLKDIPVLYTGERCFLDLTVGEQLYTIYRKHKPTRSTQFNAGHGIQHAWRYGDRSFDIGVEEHHHTPHIDTFYGHGQKIYAVRTGSYKVRDAHALEGGHVDGGIGTPVLVLFPYKREIVHFETITSAIEFLEAA